MRGTRGRGRAGGRRVGQLPAGRARVQPRPRRTRPARLPPRARADPTYVPDLAGLAKVAWARATYEGAIAGSPGPRRRFPSPEYVIGPRRPPDARRAIGSQPSSSTPWSARRPALPGERRERGSRAGALRRRPRATRAGAVGAARRVGPAAERPRGRRVRVGAPRQRDAMANAARYARIAMRLGTRNALVRLPRRDDPAARSATCRRAGATSARPSPSTRTSRSCTPPHAGRALAEPSMRADEIARGRCSGVGRFVLVAGRCASAHPLGNFTVNRYSRVVVLPGRIRVDYVVDMAEIPTFQVLPAIDADGDGRASATELGAWAARRAPALAAGLDVTVDAERRPHAGRRGRPAAGRAGRPADPAVRGHVRSTGPAARRARVPRRQLRGSHRLAGGHRGRRRRHGPRGVERPDRERQRRAPFIPAGSALEPARGHVDDRFLRRRGRAARLPLPSPRTPPPRSPPLVRSSRAAVRSRASWPARGCRWS